MTRLTAEIVKPPGGGRLRTRPVTIPLQLVELHDGAGKTVHVTVSGEFPPEVRLKRPDEPEAEPIGFDREPGDLYGPED